VSVPAAAGRRPARSVRSVRSVGVAVVLLAAGAVIATATVLVHQLVWGLPLGVLALVATLLALPGGWGTRGALGLGWILAVVWLSRSRPEGDFLVADTWRGYVLMGLVVVPAAITLLTLPRPRMTR
jgi:hypothetical protein